MSRPEVRRTPAEEFSDTYGYRVEYRPLPRKPVPIAEDDRSELYYLVMERCAELKIETSILARLREAEDEAMEWLEEHGRPERLYRQMLEDISAEMEAGWEERADHKDYR